MNGAFSGSLEGIHTANLNGVNPPMAELDLHPNTQADNSYQQQHKMAA
jgi:hypothetical protein